MTQQAGRVVVFGANGFVGSHLMSELQTAGVDALPARRPDGTRLDIAAHSAAIRSLVEGASVVVNAAGTAHTHSHKPADFWSANVTGARNIAREAVEADVQTLIHVSSASVGAGGLQPPASTSLPINAYGASKAAGELAVEAETRRSITQLVVVRPAGIGGDKSPGAWGTIRRLVREGKRVPVPANEVCHDVVEIQDVVDFLTRAIHGRVSAGVHHLAGPGPVTVRDYARRVAAEAGTTPRFLHVPTWTLRAALASTSGLESAVRPAKRVNETLTTLTHQRPLMLDITD